MILYIIDTTKNPQQIVQFETYHATVKYLEEVCAREYNMTRRDRMIMLESLGHGYDDPQSVTFVRSMADKFEMGIIRNDAGELRRMKCDIPSIALYQKEEFGN